MTKIADSRAISFCKMICAAAVGFLVLISCCFNAFAFDKSYMGDDSKWNDADNVINVSDGNFHGCLKYIIDEEDDCAYFFLYFMDNTLKGSSKKPSLTFDVKNSTNSYHFAVSADESDSDLSSNVTDNFNIYSDFSHLNMNYGVGEMYVAFEFKNSSDKKLENIVSCEYSCGNFDCLLKKNIVIDLVPATTQKAQAKTTEKTSKQTTVKTTTEKKTTTKTTKTTTKSSTKPTTKKTSKSTTKKSTTAKSTKFSPSVRKSQSTAASVTSKSSQQTSAAESSVVNETIDAGEMLSQITDNSSVLNKTGNDNFSRSTESKVLFAVGILVFVIGTLLVIYGSLKGKYKIVPVSDDDAKEENTESQNDDDDETNDE